MHNDPAFRIEHFASEDNKIHGVSEGRDVLPRAAMRRKVQRLVEQGYWVEVFDARTNELTAEHAPQ